MSHTTTRKISRFLGCVVLAAATLGCGANLNHVSPDGGDRAAAETTQVAGVPDGPGDNTETNDLESSPNLASSQTSSSYSSQLDATHCAPSKGPKPTIPR